MIKRGENPGFIIALSGGDGGMPCLHDNIAIDVAITATDGPDALHGLQPGQVDGELVAIQ